MRLNTLSAREKEDIKRGDTNLLKKVLQEELDSTIKYLIDSRIDNRIEQGRAQILSCLIKLLN